VSMTRHITYNQKRKWTPMLLSWGDDPTHCYQCSIEFTEDNPREWDHLNSIDTDNYPENMGWICHSCNVRKRMNKDMQAKALGKLRMNTQFDTFVCVDEIDKVTSSEQRGRQNKPIALQFITEQLMVDNSMLVNDIIPAISNLCFEMNETGSHEAVRRYIKDFTNPYNGKFELSKDDRGRLVIQKRIGN